LEGIYIFGDNKTHIMFKKLFVFLIVIASIAKQAQGQTWVVIPDAQFVTYLQGKIPTAMHGDSLNTSDTLVTTTTWSISVASKSIANLSGIQYFTSLQQLDCSSNSLTTLPTLPNSLTHLYCETNSITTLPALPNSLTLLNCGANSLTMLPVLTNSLVNLYCSINSLTTLPALPHSLKTLSCDHNQLTSIPVLPDSLQDLECNNNALTNLPALPNSLTNLICLNNSLTNLPALPPLLTDLYCDHNSLTSLPALPNPLTYLYCQNNSLTSLPALPSSLQLLYCDSNNITCFPNFPNSISQLIIDPNPYNCLPNYIYAMGADTTIYPKCAAGNTHNCPIVDTCPPYMTFTLTPSGTPHVWDAYPTYSSNVDSARWYWGDTSATGAYLSTAGLYPSHTYSAAGTYSIEVDVYSSCGSRGFFQNDSVYRMANSTMVTINVLHPTTAISQYSNLNANVSIYPNPASTSLQVSLAGNIESSTLVMTDMLGNAIYHSTFTTQHKVISVADLAEGVYNISISTNEGMLNKRVVIVR
jgi:Leucine-rich repeat (LRR) protein